MRPIARALSVLLALPSLLAGASGLAAAAELDDTVAALRRMPVVEPGDTDLPPAAIPLEMRFKRLLRDEAERLLPATEAAQVDLPALQLRLDALAARHAPADDGDGDEAARSGPVYGNVLLVAAERPAGHPELLALRTSVRVVCGADVSVALLARRGGRWVELLDIDAGAIAATNDAFVDVAYALTPTRADGSFDAVAANVNPWCQSNWQTLRHAVHRVDPVHGTRRLFAGEESIYIGVDPPVYRIRLRRDGYTLHFEAGDPGEPDSTRGRSVDVRIAGDRVTRGATRLDPRR